MAAAADELGPERGRRRRRGRRRWTRRCGPATSSSPARCATSAAGSCCAPPPRWWPSCARCGLRVHTGPMRQLRPHRQRRGRARAAGRDRRARRRHGVGRDRAGRATRAGPVPIAVVRVIVDTAHSPLARLATIPAGARALRTLRRLGPALSSVGRAGRPAAGRARRRRARSAPASSGPSTSSSWRCSATRARSTCAARSCTTRTWSRDLERQGAVFVDELDEVPDGTTVVFSAHGVAPAVREEAARRGLNVIDATCPLVAKVHTEARRFAGRGDTVLFIGHDGPRRDRGHARRGARPDHAGRRPPAEAEQIAADDPEHGRLPDADDARRRRGRRDRRRAAPALPADRSRRRPTTSATRPPTASRRCGRSPPNPTW